VSDWQVPGDKPSRILYQSVKKLLYKALAHRESQQIPAQCDVKDKQREIQSQQPLLQTISQPPFVPNLIADQFHAHHNYMGIPHQGIQHQGIQQQFYIPQQIPQEDILHQNQVPWFYDQNVLPLHSDHDLVFHAEYWSGMDPVKDFTLHGGTA
jgi:hypothetical protein